MWFVTGGAGYIGSHVVRDAYFDQESIHVIDDLSSGFLDRIPSGLSIHKVSLQDLGGLRKVFEVSESKRVIHLAAKKQVGESFERPDHYWQENVVGFENLISIMGEFDVKKLLFSSSAAVYGQPNLPVGSLISEADPCRPISPYGQTKLEGERLAREYAMKSGASVIALRYFNVAGAGNKGLADRFTFNLIPIVFEAIDRGQQPIIFGNDYETADGSCIRDYIHVQDLADAHIAALNLLDDAGPGFDVFNIGTGVGASVLEVLDTISAVTGKIIHPKIVGRRQGDPASLVADVSKANKVLKWESKRNLHEIISSAWDAWMTIHKDK